jgi:hypothetical protein
MTLNVPVLPSATLPPTDIVRTLVTGRTYFTSGAEALRVLMPFVMPPSGEALVDWLRCLSFSGYGCGDPVSVDVTGLLAAVDAQIIQPRRAAQAMLLAHPYLTRLYTTMSAADMTLDPEFRADPALADETGVHDEVTVVHCDASHYANEAPTTTSIGTRVLRSSAGTVADDAAFCHSRGLYLPGETPMTTSSMSTSRGLCGCRAGSRRGHLGMVALIAVVAAWIDRRRKRG